MSSIERKVLISIIKILMNKDQFDLIKHYQACIEKSTVPFSYKIQFRNGICYMLSIKGATKLSVFIDRKPSFIAIYKIIHLFESHYNCNELKKEYVTIIQNLDKPSIRTTICLEKLFESLLSTHQKSKDDFNTRYVI